MHLTDETNTMIRRLLFYVIQGVLLPLSFLGFTFFLIKAITIGRKSGMSATALVPLFFRWLLNILGQRPDELSNRMLLALPGVSKAGLFLMVLPIVLGIKLTGYRPSPLCYPYEADCGLATSAMVRTTFIDKNIERHHSSAKQIVVLGAGFDTRAYSFGVSVFEIDAFQTQNEKRNVLNLAGIDISQITFVSVDFNRESWFEELKKSGFDPLLPSIILWEGVT